MGYVNTVEEFDAYVKMEYPYATKVKSISNRGSGAYYYTDGDYNIFYHRMDRLNGIAGEELDQKLHELAPKNDE